MATNADREKRWNTLKRTVLRLSLAAVLFAESALIYVELPKHIAIHSFLVHFGVVLSVILLPLTFLALVARLPIGRRNIGRRFIVKPFHTAKQNSAYSGTAVAMRLYREILEMRSWYTGRDDRSTVSVALPEHVTVSFYGSSIPLEWIWTTLRRLITGRADVIIEGLIEDSETPARLFVWSNCSADNWRRELSDGQFFEQLDFAVASLAPEILKTLDPINLATIFWSRGSYVAAIELLESQELTLASEISLINIYLECDRNEAALRRLRRIRSRKMPFFGELPTELLRMQAQALTNLGKYQESLRLLEEQLAAHACPASQRIWLRSAIAANHAYAHSSNLSTTLDAFQSAVAEAWKQIQRLVPGATIDGLTVLENYCKDRGNVDELPPVAFELSAQHRAMARELQLAGQDPTDQYAAALDVLRVVGVMTNSPLRLISLNAGGVTKALAHYETTKDPAGARSVHFDALNWYEETIKSSNAALRFSHYVDWGVTADLAWSYFGRFVCLYRLLQIDAGQPVDLETESGLDIVTRMTRDLSAAAVAPFNVAVRRSVRFALEGGEKFIDSVIFATLELLKSMLAELSLERIEFWVEQLDKKRSSLVQHATKTATADDTVARARLLAELATLETADSGRYFRQDIPDIAESIMFLLIFMCRRAQAEEFDGSENRARMRADMDDALRECEHQFGLLAEQVERRHKAECFYGLACLAAVQSNADEAIKNLDSCFRSAGNESFSSSYVNRAKTDEDLDGIRAAPGFQSLVYERNKPARPATAVPSA